MQMRRRFLASVTDKTGIEKFKRLVDAGWEGVSTGGTGKALTAAGIPYIPVEQVTGFPEMMEGRLKTLDPRVFGGILADRTKASHMDALVEHAIHTIDLVVVNLYDFRGNPGIKDIDIGGPSILRAAAKNHASVTGVCYPAFYDLVIGEILAQGNTSPETRLAMAAMIFDYTAKYDVDIARWFRDKDFSTVHSTHKTRLTDSSVVDEVCEYCGAADLVPGGLEMLVYPCPKSPNIIVGS